MQSLLPRIPFKNIFNQIARLSYHLCVFACLGLNTKVKVARQLFEKGHFMFLFDSCEAYIDLIDIAQSTTMQNVFMLSMVR